MTNKEYYEDQLKKDLENIEELKQERKKAFNVGDMETYRLLTKGIQEINLSIRAYMEAYLEGAKL